MNVLLAKKYDQKKHDVTGWLASEKIDGVRAYWTGTELLTRNGNPIHAPDWWTEDLPDHALDGELTAGRGTFPETCSVVRSSADEDDRWEDISFAVFDVPDAPGTLKQRLAVANASWPVIQVRQITVRNRDHVSQLLTLVEDAGGEGIMLRDPRSEYERKRSDTLLKVKRMHDLDAEVIGHKPGTGQHAGRCGALICLLPSGVEFSVGAGMAITDRLNPAAIGDTVIVQHQNLTSRGCPRHPVFLGVRAD